MNRQKGIISLIDSVFCGCKGNISTIQDSSRKRNTTTVNSSRCHY